MLAAGAAFAQSGNSPRDAAGSDLLRQRDQELETARSEQKRAIENEKKLRAEIDALGEDRRKFNQALIDGAARVQGYREAADRERNAHQAAAGSGAQPARLA